jgi:hypothetical protein
MQGGLEKGKAEALEPERTKGTVRMAGRTLDQSRRIHRSTDQIDTLHLNRHYRSSIHQPHCTLQLVLPYI